MKTVQRKKRKKTLLNFYTFQVKESKMNRKCFINEFYFSCRKYTSILFVSFADLTKLREKFEEDKKKIEALKSKRNFRPF